MSRLRQMLWLHEGRVTNAQGRHVPYVCPTGFKTIGCGRNLDANPLTTEEINKLLDEGVSNEFAEWLLDRDINSKEKAIRNRFDWYDSLDEVRKAVVVDMVFNLGLQGFSGFRNTIACIAQGDYEGASVQMLDSRWANQVGTRAVRLSKMMKSGEWY